MKQKMKLLYIRPIPLLLGDILAMLCAVTLALASIPLLQLLTGE